MKIEYVDKLKENWFLVTWDLSNKCNYRCSYCPSMFNDGSSGWPELETVNNFVKNINDKLPFKDICFRISGGEPTYWKHFIDFAKTVKEHKNSFSFLSNGSRDISYFKEINQYTDGLMLSYHPEFADANHFIEIAKVMDCPVIVNLMISPDNFESMKTIASAIYSASNASVWPKVILDKTSDINNMSNKPVEYTTEQKSFIESWPYFGKVDDSKIHRGEILFDSMPISANKLILNGLNKHKNWECYAGLDMINVDFWGNVFRANCEQGGSLGHISDFKLPDNKIICQKDSCNCLSDIYLRKSLPA